MHLPGSALEGGAVFEGEGQAAIRIGRMIDALLRSYQGVIAAETGHISVHEAGAIEANGHKVLALPHQYGKISAGEVEKYLDDYYNDANHEHMVMPGMIYLSHPTEYGTLYSKAELQAFRNVCDKYGIYLYVDGARLAYALSCPDNDVTLRGIPLTVLPAVKQRRILLLSPESQN